MFFCSVRKQEVIEILFDFGFGVFTLASKKIVQDPSSILTVFNLCVLLNLGLRGFSCCDPHCILAPWYKISMCTYLYSSLSHLTRQIHAHICFMFFSYSDTFYFSLFIYIRLGLAPTQRNSQKLFIKIRVSLHIKTCSLTDELQ